VELLVVIGIIAVLIGILLPALNRARRQAKTMACSSNMKQIAQGMLMYINDNKGHLPPTLISGGDPQVYTDGWFWAAELMHQKYVNAPNIYAQGATSAQKNPDQASVFRCPEGVAPTDWPGASGTGSASNGTAPPDAANNAWVYGVAANPRADGQTPYGVETWYQLCTRVTGYASDDPLTGTNNPSFLYFDASKNGVAPATTSGMNGQLTCPSYSRVISNIRKSSVMVMIAEADAINWVDNGNHPRNGSNQYAVRLGARHGQITADKNNAYTNFAFFDGHVALMPTQPINYTVGGTASTHEADGTIFLLHNQ
jgi:prepilin-type processing-associated H-X9-DG protein